MATFTEKEVEIFKNVFCRVMSGLTVRHINTHQDWCEQEAMHNVLIAKGVVTYDEFNEALDKVEKEADSREKKKRIPVGLEATREWQTLRTLWDVHDMIDRDLSKLIPQSQQTPARKRKVTR